MSEKELDVSIKKHQEEIIKCIKSPYYFATTYLLVNDKPFTTRLTEREYNEEYARLGLEVRNRKSVIPQHLTTYPLVNGEVFKGNPKSDDNG